MICPNCHAEIELTWKRYVTSPLSRFVCAECSTKFKLKRPLYYWLLPPALFIGIFGGGITLVYCGGYSIFALTLLTLMLSILFFMIDKNLENKLETIEMDASVSQEDNKTP